MYTFGLNDSHQLGHVPPPKQCLCPRMVTYHIIYHFGGVGGGGGMESSLFCLIREFLPRFLFLCFNKRRKKLIAVEINFISNGN